MLRPDAIPIFVGFDQREAAVYHAFCQSVLERASIPVMFIPLAKGVVPAWFDGKRDGSNAFIYSRFLIPWICRFQGWAMYADGDMICRTDIVKLWDLRKYGRTGVMVAKHDYRTKHPRKYLGSANEDYPRKNWSSMILWNCGYFPNRVLTPEHVASEPGANLHRFSWLEDDEIGEVPLSWNWLVAEYEPKPDADLLHYTVGAPCFREFANCDQSSEWSGAWSRASAPLDTPELGAIIRSGGGEGDAS